MPYPAPPGITGSACTLAAPHKASAAANKVVGLMARRKCAWVGERLAGFINSILREVERQCRMARRSDRLGGERGRRTFESVGTERNYREIPDTGRKRRDLKTGVGRIRDQDTVVEIRTAAAIENAIPGEIVERLATHFR